MTSLINFINNEFRTQKKQWEELFLKELKIDEISNKDKKKFLNGDSFPTLSLNRLSEVQLSSQAWKKAASTYSTFSNDAILEALKQDLEGGVRSFFLNSESLTQDRWNEIHKILAAHKDSKDIEVIFLGQSYESPSVKTISKIISGQKFHDEGGDSVQELALMAKNLISCLPEIKNDLYIGVYVGSEFFHNISKLRAARLLVQKILEEKKIAPKVHLIALTSFQGWTLYERYSNMLRNETALASAYIGGADIAQSSGYNILIERETNSDFEFEHFERSQRMARNTSHILALESFLGVVQDAAYGSYHLENLTEKLCQDAWDKMQKLLKGADLSKEVSLIREARLERIKTRKDILSGTNDFPDVKEVLNLELKESSYFRASRGFEELRLKMEKIPAQPRVYIALYGDYSALNGRVNFVKNYFELLGLEVFEPGKSEFNFSKSLSNRDEEIIALCAQDDDYEKLGSVIKTMNSRFKFIAGKAKIEGVENLFAGQNVFDVLARIVSSTEGKE